MSTARIPVPLFAVVIVAGVLGHATPAGSAALAACTIGETHAPNVTMNTFDLTDFSVYQLLDPAECAACSGGALDLTSVSWRFKYYQTQCPLRFEVSVVKSDQSACPKPDSAQVLCGPTTFTYVPTGDPSPTVTMPMPAACCITSPAFLRVHITNTGGCGQSRLGFFAWAPGYPTPCRSYASIPGYPLQDSSDLLGMMPTITVAAECCNATPVRRQSWGGTKVLYR